MRKIKRILGLMSGTSVDGCDMAIIHTDGLKITQFAKCAFVPWQDELRLEIKANFGKFAMTKNLNQLSIKITNAHIRAIQANFTDDEYDVIGFHGQTIYHAPHLRRTRQLGDGDSMAKTLHKPVVWDFRSADVKMGGQGAPLIPIFHQALAEFHEIPKPYILANIGGVSNITYDDGNCLLAGDIGVGNALIDDYCQKYFNQRFDENGTLAMQGKINQKAVESWCHHEFFAKPLPKSMDRNEFHGINYDGLNHYDVLASLCEFTARGFSSHIKQLPQQPKQIIIGGGGRKNAFIMQRIAQLTDIAVVNMDNYTNFGDYCEAQAFAFLAARAINNYPFCFASTTNSPCNHAQARISW